MALACQGDKSSLCELKIYTSFQDPPEGRGFKIAPPRIDLIIVLHLTLLGGTPGADDFCQFDIKLIIINCEG